MYSDSERAASALLLSRTIWAALLAVATGPSACVTPETLWINDPPAVEGAVTTIWFISWDRGQLVHAQSTTRTDQATQFPALAWKDGPPSEFTITAAYYRRSLFELDLPEGRLAEADAPRPCTTHQPDAVFVADVVPNSIADWMRVTELTPSQRDFLTTGATCQRDSRCRAFEVDVIPLDERQGAIQLLALPNERFLLAQDQGVFSVVNADMTIVRQPQLERKPWFAMARRTDGELLFGGRGGQLTRGPLAGPFSDTVILDGRFDILALAFDDATQHTYAIAGTTTPTATAAVVKHDGDGWRIVWLSEVGNIEIVQSRLLRTGPDELIGVYGGRFVLRIEGDRVDAINAAAASPFGGTRLNTIAQLEDADGEAVVYAGGTDSVLYRALDASLRDWEIVGSAGFFGGIIGLGTIPNGLLLGGEAGVVQAYYPDEGFCPAQGVAGSDVEVIANFRDAILISGGAIDADNAATVSFLR